MQWYMQSNIGAITDIRGDVLSTKTQDENVSW